MEKNDALEALSALSQETRLDVFQLLMRFEPDGLAAGDIAERLGVPPNTLSSHLAVLTRAGLATSERRSRQIIYRAQTKRIGCLVGFLVQDCCGGHPERCELPTGDASGRCSGVPDRVYNVLFLCTGNSARSILAESILNQLGAGRFRAFSAGSHPSGTVHPLAIEVLAEDGCPTDGLRSKSWDAFATADAPAMDFVFTVCDSAAGESCPVWPGQPLTAHWGLEDPARASGTRLQQKAAFVATARYLRNRIAAFLALPLASIDRLALTRHLREIGRLVGATRFTGDPS